METPAKFCFSNLNNSSVPIFFVQIEKRMKNTPQVLKKTELLGQQFMVFGTPDRPLFHATDIAQMLELTNVTDMINRVDDDERSKFNLERGGSAWFLTEFGLYEVLMQSRKQIAKEFKNGVKNILKEIRTTGRFETTKAENGEIDSRFLHQKLEVAKFCMDNLRMNEVSRLNIVEPIARQFGIELPEYVQSKGVLKSATELLRRNKESMSIHDFNRMMMEAGYLKENERTTSGGKKAKFKTLTEKGMEFGENLVSKYCPMETQPEYYSDKFATLLSNLKN